MNTYAVIGGTLWGNRGAEAMVVTTIARTRERDPGARFLLLSYMYERDRELNQDPTVLVRNASPATMLVRYLPFAMLAWLLAKGSVRLPDRMLPRGVADLRSCRALFDVSGISFHDGRWGVTAYNVVSLWAAMLLGVPVVRLSQAMGPFRQPLNRLPARAITRGSFVSFSRGARTSDYLRSLDVPRESWEEAADIAFAYRTGDSLTTENPEAVERVVSALDEVRAELRPVAALVPSSLVLKQTLDAPLDYVALLGTVLRHLTEAGYHVVVMPNATSDGSDTLRNNDLAVIRRLRDQLTAADPDLLEHSTFVDFDLNTESIRSIISSTALVVTSRFHAMVAALALGVPAFIIGWSHKYEEVLEMFGCQDDTVAYTDSQGEILAKLDDLLGGLDDRARRIEAALPAVTASAETQFDVVLRLPDRTSR